MWPLSFFIIGIVIGRITKETNNWTCGRCGDDEETRVILLKESKKKLNKENVKIIKKKKDIIDEINGK